MKRLTTMQEESKVRFGHTRAVFKGGRWVLPIQGKQVVIGATLQGPIARVNKLLKKAGREERVIKGHGYMYLVGGIGLNLGSIYAMNLEKTEEDFQYLRSEVKEKFAAKSINVAI